MKICLLNSVAIQHCKGERRKAFDEAFQQKRARSEELACKGAVDKSQQD
jgi:hypothetical protein